MAYSSWQMALVTEMKEMFKQASVLQPLSQAVVILETFYAFMISCAFMIKPQNISCSLTGLQRVKQLLLF